MTGVILEDGFAQATNVRISRMGRHQSEKNTWLQLTVTEGRNHLVKRMLESVGHPVIRLRRLEFAGLGTKDIKPGSWRNLRKEELKKLKALGRVAKAKRFGGPNSED